MANKKEKMYYPTCLFCGNQMLPVSQYKNQAAANKSATMSCSCSKAKEYQEKEKIKEERKRNITRLTQGLDDFARFCEKRNIEFNSDLQNTLQNIGISIIDGILESANVKICRVKINIKKNSKDNIIISLSYSEGRKLEV